MSAVASPGRPSPPRGTARPLSRARRALAALVAVAAAAADDGSPVLLQRQEEVAAVGAALMALSRGEVEAFEALPSRLFLAPVPWPDEGDDECQRRWTRLLPNALARLGPQPRARALAALDRLWRAQVDGLAAAEQRARLAVHFLPAPAAVEELRRAGDRAFDHGRFARFLAIAALLDHAGAGSGDARRLTLARALDGRGASVDPGLALAAPGLPVASEPGADDEAEDERDDGGGLTVGWRVVPGWLTALDPWGAVLWQRTLAPRTLVHIGAGAALLRDAGGARLVDEDGIAIPLPPMPERARVVAIAGGAVWFNVDADVHRLALADHALRTWRLPGPPLGPPVVRGGDSLWLCTGALATIDAAGALTLLRHGLPARPGWRLLVAGGRVSVVGDAARRYHLEPFAAQAARADTLGRARLLRAAGRVDQALAALAGDAAAAASPAGAELRVRLLLSQAAPDAAALAAAAATPAQRAMVAWWMYHDAVPGSPGAAALAAALAAAPTVELARDRRRLGDDPADWDHVVSGAALGAVGGGRPAVIPDARRPLLDQAQVPMLHADEGERTPRGLRYRGRLITLGDDGEERVLRCVAGDGALLWWRRWPSPPTTSAPGTSIDGRDDHLLVGEGARLTVFDLALGDLRCRVDAASLALAGARVAAGRLAALAADGSDRDLVLADGEGVRHHALPAPARWLAPCGDAVLVALADGRCLRWPGAVAVELPAALRDGPMPAATAEGLLSGGRLWAWRPAAAPSAPGP